MTMRLESGDSLHSTSFNQTFDTKHGKMVVDDALNMSDIKVRNLPESAKKKMVRIGKNREERLKFPLTQR